MKLILILLTVITLSNFGFTQSNKDRITYLKNQDSLRTGQTFTYYINTYEVSRIDSLMRKNSTILKKLDSKNFIKHELARVLFYRSQQNLDSALVTISNLQGHKLLNQSPTINASFETLFGIICYDLNRPKESRKHYLIALSENNITNDSIGIKGNLINLGNSYFLEEQFDSAEFYFKKADHFEKLGIIRFSVNLSNNFATVYQNTNRYELAIQKYLEILSISTSNNRTHYHNLGLVYYKNNEIEKAIEAYQNAIDTKVNTSGTGLSNIYTSLSYALSDLNRTQEAYNALIIGDSLRKTENTESSNILLDALTLEHKEELFNKEQQLTNEKIENEKVENFYLTLILIISLLLLSVSLFLFFLKEKKNKLLLKQNLELTKNKEKVQIPIIDKSISIEIIEKLEILLYKKEVFVDPNLTLEKLAKLLKSNRTYVSENINLHYNVSFSALIKTLRIKKAREMLIDKEFSNYSIEGIATSVGYKSISSFNSSFKKETGITPSYFRKNA